VLKIVRSVLTWIFLVDIVGRSLPPVRFVSDHPRLDGKPRRAKKLAAAFMNGPILVCFVTSMKQGQEKG
jgi:hypothetical protein